MIMLLHRTFEVFLELAHYTNWWPLEEDMHVAGHLSKGQGMKAKTNLDMVESCGWSAS